MFFYSAHKNDVVGRLAYASAILFTSSREIQLIGGRKLVFNIGFFCGFVRAYK
jgi:hypothetical protein